MRSNQKMMVRIVAIALAGMLVLGVLGSLIRLY